MRAKVGVTEEKYCMPDTSVPPPLLPEDSCGSGPNVANFFQRKVDVDLQSDACDAKLAKVEVVTSWRDGKCQGNQFCHESKLISCMSNL